MRRTISYVPAIFVALTITAASPALADKPPHELRFTPKRDWAILGAAVAVDLGVQFTAARRNLGCSWCDYRDDASGARVDTLNGLDRAGRRLRWDQPQHAVTLSNVAWGMTPALTVPALVWMGQHAGVSARESWRDVVMVGQAVAVSHAINQVVKVSVRRHRPEIHALGPDATADDADQTLSFFSAHTSTTFSLVASAATVATLRGYRAAPWMWSGLALAGATGYFRMAADKHYATDVLVGAAVGTAVGVGMTYLLHGREPAAHPDGVRLDAANLMDDGNGALVSLSGAF